MRLEIPQLLFLLFLFTGFSSANDILISKQSSWKYLDDGSDQGQAWASLNFDDNAWSNGNAPLGFGDPGLATVINNHQQPVQTGAASWYFRKKINIANPSVYHKLALKLLRDDGIVVYLNGSEILRQNMPSGDIFFDTLASSTVGGDNETFFFSSDYLDNFLLTGDNILAVEIHQKSLTSSDLGFDLELTGMSDNLSLGPFLQSQSSDSITIRWDTFDSVDSRVKWGYAVGSLDNTVDDTAISTYHEVRLTGLQPSSIIYYSIGSTTEVYAGNSADFFFQMPPVQGEKSPVRIWAVGDSGTSNANAESVKNAYLSYTSGTQTNLWLMLGDNAYSQGTKSQYKTAVFDMYPELLKSSALWPTVGNHDAVSSNSLTQTGVYYDIFSLPTEALTDGISSGVNSYTEAYYSFDYANIHFVVLESNESNSTFRTGMLDWLDNDLLMTHADWVIAIWHHPPYTKGSHDSDTESKLIYMRENVLQTLENKGIDLVLGGHSHSYERSWLIDGHYGISDTFSTLLHLISGFSGNPGIDGSYDKELLGSDPHKGAVYAVAGSSGKTGNIEGDAHEAMRNTLPLQELGSLVIDINRHVMDVRFLNSSGQISDYFRITKADIIFANDFE